MSFAEQIRQDGGKTPTAELAKKLGCHYQTVFTIRATERRRFAAGRKARNPRKGRNGRLGFDDLLTAKRIADRHGGPAKMREALSLYEKLA